jgi:branched-chain amino acid transport system ATP-binding protein
MNVTSPLLEIDNLVVEIQSMPALRGFSMSITRGAMVSLVGRNGAGKTTLMRSIMGHLKSAQGMIRFEGTDLAARPRHARAALGIGYMPEDRCLVPQLTVEENILLPLWVADHLDRKARLDFVYQVIGELTEMRHRKALLLSGGQQKLVALGRALAIGTRCLLLDEPFEGIAPALSERLSQVLASLRGKDLTLLMSQSDMNHSRGLIDVEFTIEREVRRQISAGELGLNGLRYPF